MVIFTFMDNETEEFFDSLDDEQHPEVTVNETCNNNNNNSDTNISITSTTAVQEPSDITDETNKRPRSKIPIYIGHDEKELIVNLESKTKIKQYSSSSTVNVKNSKFKLANVTLPNIKPVKTYLGIFYAKHGIGPDKTAKSVTDSARAIYEGTTARTLSSFKSCSSINEPAWDTVSMYENYMVKLQPNKGDSNKSITESIISEVDIENLLSVSEACMVNKKQNCAKNKTKRNSNVYILRPSSLGGLGPDLESCKAKMIKLRRQQEYGKQADIRNRVKFIQKLAKENTNLK